MLSIYSFSSLDTFERCPQKFKFKYVDKIKIEKKVYANLYLGNAVHRVLKKLYQHGFDGVLLSLEDARKLYRDEWNKLDIKTVMVDSEYHTVDDYIRLGEEMLEKYYDKFQPFDDGVLLGAELPIYFELPGTPFKFKCIIDRFVKLSDGKVQIWDYKTGQNMYSPSDKHFVYQMGLYQLAVQSEFSQFKEIELAMYFLRHQEAVTLIMNPDELDLLIMDMKSIINSSITATRLDSFSIKEGNHCQWCDFHDLCPAKRHKKLLEEIESDESLSFTPEQLKDKATAYINLYQEHAQLKGNLEGLKEELKDIARDTGLKVLEGDKGKVSISLKNKESFVTKTQGKDEYYKLSMLCRDLELFDYFIPDTNSILKDYRKGLFSDDKYTQLEDYINVSETGTVRVKLNHESDDDNELA